MSIGRGSFSFQPGLVEALLRRYQLESGAFADWLAAEATRAECDIERHAA